MFFILRCAFWLAVVFLAIGVLDGEPTSVKTAERTQTVNSHGKEAPARAASAPQKNQSASATRSEDKISGLAAQAEAKLVGAARDQCLAHPMECLQTLERVGRISAWPEPPRR